MIFFCLSFFHQTLPLSQNWHLLKWFCYKFIFIESFVFKGVLALSAIARNEKITFSPFFGYIEMWFVYAPYMLIFFVFSISKL
jgi:hypothetical protein